MLQILAEALLLAARVPTQAQPRRSDARDPSGTRRQMPLNG